MLFLATILLSLVLVTVHGFNISHFNPCKFNTKGVCMNLDDYHCPLGYKVTNSGCPWDESCCYPYVESKPKFKYGDDHCGIPEFNVNSRIVGGKISSILDYPWMVSIQKFSQHVCGGSIVSDRWILTAAHCVTRNSDSISIVAGTSNVRKNVENRKRHPVEKVIRHEKYKVGKAAYGYDIAMIKLTKALDLGTGLTRKVCLPTKGENFEDNICAMAGWGYTQEPKGVAASSSGSAILREANLPVIGPYLCNHYLGELRPNTICAGYIAGGEDSCQGDSGGPLVCQNKEGYWTQAGVASVGRGCARKKRMGIYTQVAGYTDWILDIIKNY